MRGYQNISSQRPQTNHWRRVRIPAWHLGMVQTPRANQQIATHFCTHFERYLQSRVADQVCGSLASRINLRLGHWKLSIEVEYVFEVVNSAWASANTTGWESSASSSPFLPRYCFFYSLCSSPTEAAREPRPTLPPLKLATAKILCQLIDLGSALYLSHLLQVRRSPCMAFLLRPSRSIENFVFAISH